MKIYVCTGHANYGNGVISSADGSTSGGCNEYNYNKELLPYIKKWCDIADIECDTDTPTEGMLHNLNDEINYYCPNANKKNYDLVLQLHLNSFDSTATGTEMWIYPNSSAKKIAKNIVNKFSKYWTNRGVKESNTLYWLKRTKAPAILVESFFCDNPKDYNIAKKLSLDSHAKLLVEGITGKELEDKKNGCKCGCKCCE